MCVDTNYSRYILHYCVFLITVPRGQTPAQEGLPWGTWQPGPHQVEDGPQQEAPSGLGEECGCCKQGVDWAGSVSEEGGAGCRVEELVVPAGSEQALLQQPSPAAYHLQRLFLWMPRKVDFHCPICTGETHCLHSQEVHNSYRKKFDLPLFSLYRSAVTPVQGPVQSCTASPGPS